MTGTHESMQLRAEQALPRMLTQVCRDLNSHAYGCWDRNWWHYKIRDFPSVILQQGGYSLFIAAELPFGATFGSKFLHDIAKASACFWNKRAIKHGAFEEYYPFEEGYPPLAFSTLATAKLARSGAVNISQIDDGLQIASRQLLQRFESLASNQQIAGTAAAAVIHQLDSSLINNNQLDALLDRSFALQHAEGWFPEYDGPDLGYLSVTMDCLWDIYDTTGDERCINALSKALGYIAWFTEQTPHQAGMHNSRNTDYLVPYAISRLAITSGKDQALASAILERIFGDCDQPSHFLAAVDDRYWCHYIGHSLFRAVKAIDGKFPTITKNQPYLPETSTLESGHARLETSDVTVLVSCLKGGILTARWTSGSRVSDFGWLLKRGSKLWISHWWANEWVISNNEDQISITGALVNHREQLSTPWKHMILRVVSFVLGRRVIALLKKLLIYKSGSEDLSFERAIKLDGNSLRVTDKFTGIRHEDDLIRAPRSSKRHVASADSYHHEDSELIKDISIEEIREFSGGKLTITTNFTPKS